MGGIGPRFKLDILELTRKGKKAVGVFKDTFKRSLIGGGHYFFDSFKRGPYEKFFVNPTLGQLFGVEFYFVTLKKCFLILEKITNSFSD